MKNIKETAEIVNIGDIAKRTKDHINDLDDIEEIKELTIEFISLYKDVNESIKYFDNKYNKILKKRKKGVSQNIYACKKIIDDFVNEYIKTIF